MKLLNTIKLQHRIYNIVCDFIDKIRETHIRSEMTKEIPYHARFQIEERETRDPQEPQQSDNTPQEERSATQNTSTINFSSGSNDINRETFDIHIIDDKPFNRLVCEPNVKLPFYYRWFIKRKLRHKIDNIRGKKKRRGYNKLINFKEKYEEQAE